MYNTDNNIGSVSNIIYSKGLVFAPSEVDMSIRPGWFYHAEEEAHSLDRLFKTYINSVGNNTSFILNVPPMPNGKFDETDVLRLKELGDKINSEFGVNIAENAEITVTPYNNSETQREIVIDMGEEKAVKYLDFGENTAEGQRVESFIVKYYDNTEGWQTDYGAYGTTVGARKIVKLGERKTSKIKIIITSARDVPEFSFIKIH